MSNINTVGQLISALQGFDRDAKILRYNDEFGTGLSIDEFIAGSTETFLGGYVPKSQNGQPTPAVERSKIIIIK